MSQGLSEQEHRKLSLIERIKFKHYIFKGIPQKRLEIVDLSNYNFSDQSMGIKRKKSFKDQLSGGTVKLAHHSDLMDKTLQY